MFACASFLFCLSWVSGHAFVSFRAAPMWIGVGFVAYGSPSRSSFASQHRSDCAVVAISVEEVGID